jgi:hypothetical protein
MSTGSARASPGKTSGPSGCTSLATAKIGRIASPAMGSTWMGGTRFGIGSQFQDELTPGQWLLVAGAWDATRVSIYRDGVLRDSDLLDQSATGGPMITPEDGDAPVRIGTRDFNSFFQGAISRVAICSRKLADSEQAASTLPAPAAPSMARSAAPPGWLGSGGWARWHEGCHQQHGWAPPSAGGMGTLSLGLAAYCCGGSVRVLDRIARPRRARRLLSFQAADRARRQPPQLSS